MQKILVTICFICCSFFSFSIFGQHIVKGFVYDELDQPLIGVTVSVKGQTLATTSGLEGEYSLKMPTSDKDYILQVSLLGYISQTKNVSKSDDNIDFYLKEKSVDLDMVVITGTRTPKLLKNSPIITKVITESDIKKIDATNIGGLLQSELPGIEFSYSMNQQVSLNMQGFGGNSVLFLIDGERVAGETLDNIDYNRLNMDNVARVEIIKGAASTLYGSSALGGVVNIITKEPSEKWSANLNSRFGTYNDRRHGGNASFSLGKFSSSTSIQHTFQDGYSMENKPQVDENGKVTIDTTQLYGSKTWNFKEKMVYRINNKIKLIGRAGYYFRQRDSQPISKDRYRGFSGGLRGNYNINDKNNLELAYSFDQFDKSTYNSVTEYDVKNYSNVQNSARGLYNHIFDKTKILTLGGDFMRDYLMSYQFKDNGSYHQYVSDVFAQFDWTPIDNFNILTGLRYDYFSDDNINRVTPKIGLMYRVGNCSLRGSYAGGFRAPSLKEMYMVFDMASVFMIYGNPDLKSETSDNFTLSTEYTNSYYNLSVTGYYNRVNNRITTAWDQALKGQVYTNIDKIDITGLDVNASAKFPCGVGARFSYAYTHEKIKKGEPLVSSTRPHTATARLEYGKSWKDYGFNIMLNGRYLSRVTSDEYTDLTSYSQTQRVSYSPYSIWKLSLLQTIYKGIDLTLAVDNLFNYTPSVYNFNSPYTKGTTFSIGVSLDIDKLIK